MSIVEGLSGIFEDPSLLSRENTWEQPQIFPGGLTIEEIQGGASWINLPNTGPSGIGTGGAGDIVFLGYVYGGAEYFGDAQAGDLAIRDNTGQMIRMGTNGSQSAFRVGYNHVESGGTATTLAGTTAGSIYWAQPERGIRKVFIAVADAYENDTATAQTIAFPTAYSYTPSVVTNTTGLTISVTTTTLTITAPDATTAYNGVIEVVGM